MSFVQALVSLVDKTSYCCIDSARRGRQNVHAYAARLLAWLVVGGTDGKQSLIRSLTVERALVLFVFGLVAYIVFFHRVTKLHRVVPEALRVATNNTRRGASSSFPFSCVGSVRHRICCVFISLVVLPKSVLFPTLCDRPVLLLEPRRIRRTGRL